MGVSFLKQKACFFCFKQFFLFGFLFKNHFFVVLDGVFVGVWCFGLWFWCCYVCIKDLAIAIFMCRMRSECMLVARPCDRKEGLLGPSELNSEISRTFKTGRLRMNDPWRLMSQKTRKPNPLLPVFRK